MTELSNLKNWHFEVDTNNIAWLTFDKLQASTNTLNDESLFELKSVLTRLQTDIHPLALVIQSAKENSFIAGADIEQFRTIYSVEAAFQYVREGQTTLAMLEALPFPTVAVIQGFCLGGGLELALACKYRIAEEDKARLGLPEVKLGIHPGWGGCIRLPRLLGTFAAMDLILSGRTVDAKSAYKLGLVDAVVPKRNMNDAIRYYTKGSAPQKKLSGAKKYVEKLLDYTLPRTLAASFFRKQLSKKIKSSQYPAPFAVLDNWQKTGVHGETAYLREAQSIAELVVGDTSRELVRVFFLQEKLKSIAKEGQFTGKKVHVIGAGVMGGDIAAWCALKGFEVSLQDKNLQAIASSLQRAMELFKKQLKSPHLVLQACDRLSADSAGLGVRHADLIIEAIVENIEAKKSLFSQLEEEAPAHAIFATNTSTIPLQTIGENLKNPGRLVGIHFFNPVAKMPLVEVVHHPKTTPQIMKQALHFVGQIDKLPLPVKSAPGFVVNRILMPYIMESVALLEEGIEPQVIDKAAINFGMPMGPIELADTVGLDVCYYAAKQLDPEFEKNVPTCLQKLIDKKTLGRKTGQGFYSYKGGKLIAPKAASSASSSADISDRIFLRMLNEAQNVLQDNIVTSSELLDAAMIFGTGFPPFKGGPMHYIEKNGSQNLLSRLQELANRYGSRFTPSMGWQGIQKVTE